MRICFISVEIFAWGKHGGFGRATRIIGRELLKRGVEVFAVVPRRAKQKPVENLDGITVLGFPPHKPWMASKLFREADADIYHSCEPSFGTYLAMKAMPQRKHMVTFRDPRDLNDWKMEFEKPSYSHLQVIHNFIYENNFLVRKSIRRMNAIYVNAKYLIPKVKRMYRLSKDPVFLPTPVPIPGTPAKAQTPTVCYLARLDRRKRPELFFNLARQFPGVQFIAMGKSRDKKWEEALRKRYRNLPNLVFAGFMDQFAPSRYAEILEKSWVMVNCATREALPNAFIEAASYRCAILSYVDPDGFASVFGYHAANEDFAKGLACLLKEGHWKALGLKGYEYVKETFALEKSLDLHMAAYRALLSQSSKQKMVRRPLFWTVVR